MAAAAGAAPSRRAGGLRDDGGLGGDRRGPFSIGGVVLLWEGPPLHCAGGLRGGGDGARAGARLVYAELAILAMPPAWGGALRGALLSL